MAHHSNALVIHSAFTIILTSLVHSAARFTLSNHPDAFVSTAPEQQPYRKEAEIRSLFNRLRNPVKRLDSYATCHIVAI